MMGTWYGTLLISEYGITILIHMVMVNFMVTLFYGYVVYSSDYSFLNIAWDKLLSMIFILLTGYQFWVLWNDFKQGTLRKEWT